jgi:ATPase subunit of ABC transporter with duplicated ATPase domains
LDNVAGWILELDRGEGIPWKGNYSFVARPKKSSVWRRKRNHSQASEDFTKELEWILDVTERSSNKAKSPLSSYNDMLTEDVKCKKKNGALYPGRTTFG